MVTGDPNILEPLFEKIGRSARLPDALRALETDGAFVESAVELNELALDALGFVRR